MKKIAREIAIALFGMSTRDREIERVEQAIKHRTISKSRVEHLERVEKDYYSPFDFTTVNKLTEVLELAESALSLGIKTHDAAGCPGEACSYPYDTQKMVLIKVRQILGRYKNNA